MGCPKVNLGLIKKKKTINWESNEDLEQRCR